MKMCLKKNQTNARGDWSWKSRQNMFAIHLQIFGLMEVVTKKLATNLPNSIWNCEQSLSATYVKKIITKCNHFFELAWPGRQPTCLFCLSCTDSFPLELVWSKNKKKNATRDFHRFAPLTSYRFVLPIYDLLPMADVELWLL